ncbi:hypothetical protein BZA05DRAFT_398032 [Tricharina praecox]|uniref:uncharacterized protein n=1 Tax=Tricharina praecox TaxID=43433 RepID=UPI00221E891E|nr:uncharacterized protein BZA05DRAFT_398032 [Tricharina praecox]KAI5851852.1 hypothetical protein BZA05DRAFT_398032 [Tricharina praecox]
MTIGRMVCCHDRVLIAIDGVWYQRTTQSRERGSIPSRGNQSCEYRDERRTRGCGFERRDTVHHTWSVWSNRRRTVAVSATPSQVEVVSDHVTDDLISILVLDAGEYRHCTAIPLGLLAMWRSVVRCILLRGSIRHTVAGSSRNTATSSSVSRDFHCSYQLLGHWSCLATVNDGRPISGSSLSLGTGQIFLLFDFQDVPFVLDTMASEHCLQDCFNLNIGGLFTCGGGGTRGTRGRANLSNSSTGRGNVVVLIGFGII